MLLAFLLERGLPANQCADEFTGSWLICCGNQLVSDAIYSPKAPYQA